MPISKKFRNHTVKCYKNNMQNETHLKSHRCTVVVINRWTAVASCISHMCTRARVTAFSDLPPHPVAPRQALYVDFIVSSGFSLCTLCSLGAQSRHTPTKPTATSSHGRTPLHLVVCTGSCFPALSCPFLPLPEMLSSWLPHRVCRRQQSGPGRPYVGNTLPPDPTLRNAWRLRPGPRGSHLTGQQGCGTSYFLSITSIMKRHTNLSCRQPLSHIFPINVFIFSVGE